MAYGRAAVLQGELAAAEERLAARVATSESQSSDKPAGFQLGVQRMASEEVRELVARLEFEEGAMRSHLEKKHYSMAASLQPVLAGLEAELEEARRSESLAMPRQCEDESFAAETAKDALAERLAHNEAAIHQAVKEFDYSEAGALQNQQRQMEAEMDELRAAGSPSRFETSALTTELESEEAALEAAVRGAEYAEAAVIHAAMSRAEAQLQLVAEKDCRAAAERASLREDVAKAEAELKEALLRKNYHAAAVAQASIASAAAKLGDRQGSAPVTGPAAPAFSFAGKGPREPGFFWARELSLSWVVRPRCEPRELAKTAQSPLEVLR